jgi:cysteinyl-tRNA synthetase
LDIHTGGVDNAFPHHENEIAQSEAATGKPFSRFFMHGEHLLVNGVKMAKSAGNFYTLREIEEKGYDPLAFRYLCLQTHYRSKMNFTWEALEAANSALQNLRQAYSSHKNAHGPNGPVKPSRNKKTEKEILDALSDDLNTPRALAALWNAIKDRNISAEEKLYLADYADRVLGLRISSGPDVSDHTVPDEIRNLAEKREELRRQKDYAAADDARKSIEEKGYEISDGPEGYIIRKKI